VAQRYEQKLKDEIAERKIFPDKFFPKRLFKDFVQDYLKNHASKNTLFQILLNHLQQTVEERFQKGKWECIGTDRIYDEEWDGWFKPFGEEHRINYEEWERRYFESKTEEERFAAKYWGLDEFEKEED
jgi:hypothetical protein